MYRFIYIYISITRILHIFYILSMSSFPHPMDPHRFRPWMQPATPLPRPTPWAPWRERSCCSASCWGPWRCGSNGGWWGTSYGKSMENHSNLMWLVIYIGKHDSLPPHYTQLWGFPADFPTTSGSWWLYNCSFFRWSLVNVCSFLIWRPQFNGSLAISPGIICGKFSWW